MLKLRQNIYADDNPLLKVNNFSPFGTLNILIIVPYLITYFTLHEQVARRSPLLFKDNFRTGDLCALIETL